MRRRLDLGVSMYDLFKKILFSHALKNGFEHEHRFKFDKLYGTILKCVVCGEVKE